MRIRRQIRQRLRQAIAIVLSLGFVFGIAGVPVAARARKDRSQPYPCQDRPCGCSSAEECWKHCCCFTNKQKVVWARKHKVTLPVYVLEAAEREEHEAAHDDCGGCCSAKAGAGEHNHSCCAKLDHDEQPAAPARSAKKRGESDALKVKLVLTDAARQCRGLPSIVILLSEALPHTNLAAWSPIQGPLEYVCDVSLSLVSAELSPPVPPPKLGACAAI